VGSNRASRRDKPGSSGEGDVTATRTTETYPGNASGSASSIESAVRRMAESVATSAALDNEFYQWWVAAPLSYPEVEVFAGEYLARTTNTSVMVALSVLHTDDLAARTECVKNLYSEYGNGDPAKAHLVLLETFLTDLLSRLRGATVTIEQLRARQPLATTTAFSTGQRDLFTSPDQRTVQGALLAQEWLAYSMLTRLYEGVRNYKGWYGTDDEFHEACEYFYVHIGEAEKDHKLQAVASASQVCANTADLEVARRGFDGFVDLTTRYWLGVAEQMRRVR
jgi:pyrroloquinoline quinone (PQQ) biosynthesis protein C